MPAGSTIYTVPYAIVNLCAASMLALAMYTVVFVVESMTVGC